VRQHLRVDVEALVRVKAKSALDPGDLVGAQCRAVHPTGVHLLRRWEADDGAQQDDRGTIADGLGGVGGRQDRGDVFAAVDDLHVPAVRLVPGGDVLTQRDGGVVLDGDLVVVVEHDQIAQLLHARDRRCLRRHTLLDVAVRGDHVDVVVERALAPGGLRVEEPALAPGRHCHADRGCQTLAQRAGGHLHTAGVPDLGVTWRLGPPGPQRLQVVQFKAVPRQIQLGVQREAGMSTREHQAIPADPVGVSDGSCRMIRWKRV
jgi:hypothetical protein